MEALRLAAVSAPPSAQDFYEQLKEVVRPWLTLTALTKTDTAILADLLRRSQEAERRLCGRVGVMHWDGMTSVGAVMLLAVLLIATVLVFSLHWWPRSLLQVLHTQSEARLDHVATAAPDISNGHPGPGYCTLRPGAAAAHDAPLREECSP